MAAPAYQSGVAETHGAGGTFDVAAPTGIVAGDLLVMCLGTYDGAAGTVVINTGTWNARASITNDNGGAFAGKAWLFDKIATGSEPSVYSVTTSGYADVILIRANGNDTTAPYQTSTTNQGAGTTSTGLGITTTAADEMLLLFHVGYEQSLNGGSYSGMTVRQGPLDGVLYVYTESIAAAGATGNRTGTPAASDNWEVIVAAYKSPAATLAPPPRHRVPWHLIGR